MIKSEIPQRLEKILKTNSAALTVATDNEGMPLEPVRLLYGRGGTAPEFDNLNIDFYPPLLFVALYARYSDEQLHDIDRTLKKLFGNRPLLIQDRSVRPAAVRLRRGGVPDEMIVMENGLRFYLHPERGQNPGFFTDMRAGRRLIQDIVAGSKKDEQNDFRVLNLFAYTCSLSVAALAAGAAGVVNIDKNARSLGIGKRNHELNSDLLPDDYRRRLGFFPHDIFKSFGKLKKEGPYHLIIADPPPSQKNSFMLKKDYPRLIRRLPEMLAPGGTMMLTLNSPGFSWEEFESMITAHLPFENRPVRVQPPVDFRPAEDGRGLKIIIIGT